MSLAAEKKEGRCAMALTLKNSWKAGAASLAVLSMVPGAAQADDQAREYASVTTTETPQKASFATAASSTIPLTKDAEGDAIIWARDTDGIGVSVALGTGSKFTPEQIQAILINDFTKAGEPNVRFFFEQNDVPVTGVVYHYGVTGGGSSGILTLNQSQGAVQETVDQNHFYEDNPELGV